MKYIIVNPNSQYVSFSSGDHDICFGTQVEQTIPNYTNAEYIRDYGHLPSKYKGMTIRQYLDEFVFRHDKSVFALCPNRTKKELRQAFRHYLREVASQRIESGVDTFQRLIDNLMQSRRAYLMKYNKEEYRHYVVALRLNLNYMKVNGQQYGRGSYLNCNNTNYVK